MSESRIYIVRHGETDENKLHIIQGHLDTEMNEHGLKQAAKVANRLGVVPFEIAYTSDLARARVVAFTFTFDDRGVRTDFMYSRLPRLFWNSTRMSNWNRSLR